MKILVIDGQGGGLGKNIIENIRKQDLPCEIISVGTNVIATSAMLKAGADYGATGENAIIYNCEKVDFIVGPIGIIIGNSMHGEISPKMSQSISNSNAKKLLIPSPKCNLYVAGGRDDSMSNYILDIINKLKTYS